MEKAVSKSVGYLPFGRFGQALNRRQTLRAAFWAGLAAPAMLFAAKTTYILYDGNAGVAHAWGEVGRQLTYAVRSSHVG